MARALFVEIAALHEQIEGPLTPSGLDASDALHLRWRFQVFEELTFIHKQIIRADLVENQPIVFLLLGP